jgi:hypothetical protein
MCERGRCGSSEDLCVKADREPSHKRLEASSVRSFDFPKIWGARMHSYVTQPMRGHCSGRRLIKTLNEKRSRASLKKLKNISETGRRCASGLGYDLGTDGNRLRSTQSCFQNRIETNLRVVCSSQKSSLQAENSDNPDNLKKGPPRGQILASLCKRYRNFWVPFNLRWSHILFLVHQSGHRR